MSINRANKKDKVMSMLIDGTTNNRLAWVTLGELKNYLYEEHIDIRRIDFLYKYLIYMRRCKLVPDANSTYFVFEEGTIYALLKNKYSSCCRLDSYSSENPIWKKVGSTLYNIAKLYNTIIGMDEDSSKEEIEEFIYSTNNALV